MKIGTLGDVAFTVSATQIKTINSYSRTKQANYTTHAVHGGKGVVEFTGLNPETIKFKVTLSKHLGVDPNSEYDKLVSYMAKAQTIYFTLGKLVMGEYKWVIKELKSSDYLHDKNGNTVEMTVEISLTEYIK